MDDRNLFLLMKADMPEPTRTRVLNNLEFNNGETVIIDRVFPTRHGWIVLLITGWAEWVAYYGHDGRRRFQQRTSE